MSYIDEIPTEIVGFHLMKYKEMAVALQVIQTLEKSNKQNIDYPFKWLNWEVMISVRYNITRSVTFHPTVQYFTLLALEISYNRPCHLSCTSFGFSECTKS